jgi:hypothetical protein
MDKWTLWWQECDASPGIKVTRRKPTNSTPGFLDCTVDMIVIVTWSAKHDSIVTKKSSTMQCALELWMPDSSMSVSPTSGIGHFVC